MVETKEGKKSSTYRVWEKERTCGVQSACVSTSGNQTMNAFIFNFFLNPERRETWGFYEWVSECEREREKAIDSGFWLSMKLLKILRKGPPFSELNSKTLENFFINGASPQQHCGPFCFTSLLTTGIHNHCFPADSFTSSQFFFFLVLKMLSFSVPLKTKRWPKLASSHF